jgi:hypothetical protein
MTETGFSLSEIPRQLHHWLGYETEVRSHALTALAVVLIIGNVEWFRCGKQVASYVKHKLEVASRPE